jgi:hypothetical protein
MNCRDFPTDIALYVEGDLIPNRSTRLERHLAGCNECRALAVELRDSQAEIRHLRNEIVDASSLNRVHANVLEQVRTINERRTWFERSFMWLWANFRFRHAALATIVLALLAASIWRMTYNPTSAGPIARQFEVQPNQFLQPETLSPRTIDGSVPEKAMTRASLVRRSRRTHPVKQSALPSGEQSMDGQDTQSRDVVVKILTDDPNVIIYWLIDQKTGGF